MGESAGSWSVLHHMLAPGSSGLFSKGINFRFIFSFMLKLYVTLSSFFKAIAQSGAFVGGQALRPDTELIQTEKGQMVVDSASCNFNTGDKDATLACLQSLSAIDLLAIPALPRGMKLIFSY